MSEVDCSAAPGADAQCIETRMDIVFFAGAENDFSNEETKSYFTQAKAFFTANLPNVMQHDAIDLSAILTALATANTSDMPWGDIYIVAHGGRTHWYMRSGIVDGAYSIGRTVKDVMKLRDLQHDGRLPRLEARTPKPDTIIPCVDQHTRVILKSCMVGRHPPLLDVISDLFRTKPHGFLYQRAAPIVLGPLYWLFFRTMNGQLTERFFRRTEYVVVAGKKSLPITMTATERQHVGDQLQKMEPELSRMEIDDVVSNVKDGWTSGAHQERWAETGDAPTEQLDFVVYVEADGTLTFIRAKRTVEQDDGFTTEQEAITMTISGVMDADLPAKRTEVVNQVFAAMAPTAPFTDLALWQSTVSVETTEASENPKAPKSHHFTVALSGTMIRYFIMIKRDGAPVEPSLARGDDYASSTYESRMVSYYNNWRSQRFDP